MDDITLDPFQEQAISHINQGHSVIVCAPTGAGKTVIAEHVITECLARNEKVIYTAPIKALSNQKYRDFSRQYPDRVGILTGDVTINQNAHTLIMTTEIFRNKIIEEHSSLESYSWIIFDEMHYLDDLQRGSVWEESLMFLPDHMNVLGLSATIPNVNEISDWLKNIHHRPMKVVIEKDRPVPLHFLFQCQNKIYQDIKSVKTQGYKSIPRFLIGKRRSRNDQNIKPNKPLDLIEHLKSRNLLPCIYFAFGRRRTESLANSLNNLNFLNSVETREIKEKYSSLCKKYDVEHEPSSYDIKPLIERGIAYHHAGMLPTLKEVVEQLFATKLIKVIFTTETFALGINMPAKTVVFDELRKIYGPFFKTLKTRDFYQMAGRAGRRGIDKEGFVFLRVNPYNVAPTELERMIYGEPEKVTSRFNASYATILNLYSLYQEKLYDVYPLSLHFHQEKKSMRKKAEKHLHNKVRLLQNLGHIKKNKITEKGAFASRVYGYELILSELYTEGILEKLSIVELGVLVMAIVYEPRKGMRRPQLNHSAKQLQKITKDLIYPIMSMEHKFHIKPYSKECFFHLTAATEAWLNGDDFNQILNLTEADEGEVVRYFRMGIQIFREILDTDISKELESKIYRAIELMNRDVVDAEKQLRG